MGRSKSAVHHLIEPVDLPASGKRDELHFARVAGLEANSRPGRDSQPKASSRRAIKVERPVRFIKVKVASYLDRPVAPVGDNEPPHFQPDVGLVGLSARGDNFSGYHRTGL